MTVQICTLTHMQNTARPLRVAEAAARIGIHPDTLRRWADAGRIPSVRYPTGERRFDPLIIDEFVIPTDS